MKHWNDKYIIVSYTHPKWPEEAEAKVYEAFGTLKEAQDYIRNNAFDDSTVYVYKKAGDYWLGNNV